MKVPLLDLMAQYATIKSEVLRETEDIFESQRFILGPKVEALEKQIAGYSNTAHAVGVSSGTDALLVSLMAAGIRAGDRVITTPYSFFASAGSIARIGAHPVFADIDPNTFNISPEKIESTILDLTVEDRKDLKAIVPVHLYGQCADMDAIIAIAEKYGLIIVEDAAQAIGAEYRGRRAGSMGEMGCFSFFPSKNLGAFGDGGVVTTNSKARFETLTRLRNHGAFPKYYHQLIGGNFRLDALQAAIVSVKFNYLDQWTNARQENAARYRRLFEAAGLSGRVVLPVEKEDRHIYNQFVIRVAEKRDLLQSFLRAADIGTEIYYPLPLHLQQCFSYLGYKPGDFPAAEASASQTLALPVYPEMSEAQQQFVVGKITQFFAL